LTGLVKTLATKRMDLDEEDAEEEDAGGGRCAGWEGEGVTQASTKEKLLLRWWLLWRSPGLHQRGMQSAVGTPQPSSRL
jgi:hypothetical protein